MQTPWSAMAWRPMPRHMARPRSMPIAPAEENKARACCAFGIGVGGTLAAPLASALARWHQLRHCPWHRHRLRPRNCCALVGLCLGCALIALSCNIGLGMRNQVTDYSAAGSILSGIMTLGQGLITSFLDRQLNARWHVDARVTRQQRRSGRKLITWQTSGMLTLASLGSNLGGSAIATLGGSALLRVASRGASQ